MPTITHAETETKRATTFTCASCGYSTVVTGRGFGDGQARGGDARAAVEALQRSRDDADVDVERNLYVLKCPQCGYRAGLAAFGWWMRQAFGPALLVGVLIFVLTLLFASARKADFAIAGASAVAIMFFMLFLAILVPKASRRWSRLALDRTEDATRSALEVFMEHTHGCKTCDIDKGRKGLCDDGKRLYRAKELAERG